MALSRQHPFAFPATFDEMFDVPAFAFPRELAPFRNNAFDSSPESFWRHPYTVHEDDKSYSLSIDIPGVRPEDMTIKIEDENVLHLSGGRKVESKDGTGFSERKFDYRMSLGDNVDKEKFTATMQDGVLKLTAPKIEMKKPSSRTIQITDSPGPMHLEADKEPKKE